MREIRKLYLISAKEHKFVLPNLTNGDSPVVALLPSLNTDFVPNPYLDRAEIRCNHVEMR